ncbi:respiratory selenite reductase-associated lipoprotein SrrE [Salisediminibacterium selenitireducens]|uniref:Rhodanese domain protein n=1 Tax=Bacillus selenitireducens (strain ATCC 700615 / DSM 15326 / MLS10) TaxID=439292 RepID=D6XT51_BACIE|nr:respiratory selenite reductase-associated lipoprotein SrrE [Salisediminibacterium selenitireducens]ADH98987.1 Rhodanese domain protein [[Bacillus] selenitireducens MLS10]
MKHKWTGLLMGAALLTATACSSDEASVLADEENDNEEQAAVETNVFNDLMANSAAYMEDPNFNVITGEALHNKTVFENPEDYFILDVRDTTTFVSGHIPGAVNVPYRVSGLEQMYLELPEDKTIYVVCFSGHTASHTVGMLNALGYDAEALQFGMGGYASGTDLGSNIPGGPAELPVVTTGFELTETHDLPEIMSDESDIRTIAHEQSQNFLDQEPPGVMGAPDLNEMINEGNLDGHQLIDIRLGEHYEQGHIEGAANLPYNELFNEENLSLLDPEKMTVVIGYNGYDASQVTRLLGQLEYSAVPLAYGMSIWSGDESVVGEHMFDFSNVYSLPVRELKFDMDAGDIEAGCR